MKKIGVILFLFLSGVSYAGNVYNYSPDVPLVETSLGIKEKTTYLCNEAQSDLSRYDDNALISFIQQCSDTRDAVRRSESLPIKETFLRMLRTCEKLFSLALDRRNNEQKYQGIIDSLESKLKAPRRDIKVTGIDVRVDRYDVIGNAWYSARADVSNYGDTGNITVVLQGIDFNGAVVATVNLRGYIERLQTAQLYKSYFMPAQNFLDIRQWRVQAGQ